MTKANMANEIARRESEAWFSFKLYEYHHIVSNYEFGCGTDAYHLQEEQPEALVRYRAVWSSLFSLLEDLGIPQAKDENAAKADYYEKEARKHLKGIN